MYVRLAGMTVEEMDQLQAALTDEFQLREKLRDLATEQQSRDDIGDDAK